MQFSDFVINNWPLFLALVIISFLLARTWIGPGAVSSIRPAEAVLLINREGAVVVDADSFQPEIAVVHDAAPQGVSAEAT